MLRLRDIRRPVLLTTSLLLATTGTAASAGGTPVNGTDAVTRWVHTTIAQMSLAEKVGQLFTTFVHGKDVDSADPANIRDFGVATPAEVVSRYHLGGVIYFQNDDVQNIDDPIQVAKLSNGLQRAALSSGAQLPLDISTDQEEGIVTRIKTPATQFPGSMALGAGRSTADAEQAAEITGAELRAMGVNLDNAPDADVNSNPANPVIGVRSFGGDPKLVSDFVAAQVNGYQRHVAATAKHFPGHGDAATDSHTGLPVINHTKQQWEQLDAPPFRAAIAAGVDSIMSAHLSFPKIDPSGEPATLSPVILTGLLRNELHYNGVVTTDSLRMEGVRTLHSDAELPVLALKAGADVLLMPKDLGAAINSVLSAVSSGDLTEARIDTSVARVLKRKFASGVLFHPLVDPNMVMNVVGTAQHRAVAQRITNRTITVLRNDAHLLPLSTKPASILVTGWDQTTTATLSRQMGMRGPVTTALPTGSAPNDAQIADALVAAGKSDLIVVLTKSLGANPSQRKLLDELISTGKPVIAVAVRDPYDAGYVDAEQTWLATYGNTAESAEAVTRVLFGEISPAGKLPVDVPSGADPTRIRYPFGTGLSW